MKLELCNTTCQLVKKKKKESVKDVQALTLSPLFGYFFKVLSSRSALFAAVEKCPAAELDSVSLLAVS